MKSRGFFNKKKLYCFLKAQNKTSSKKKLVVEVDIFVWSMEKIKRIIFFAGGKNFNSVAWMF